MAVDELLTDAVGHIVQIEAPLLLLHARMKDDLQQNVPQLLLQVLGVSLVDGLGGLIGLLQQIAPDGVMVLLPVPGTSAGRPQDADDLPQVLHPVRGLLFKIYHIFNPSASYFLIKLP